jgi:hypothetical protein
VVVNADAADFAMCIHRVKTGAALHLIRYDYDGRHDRVRALPRLELTVRLPERFSKATAHSPHGDLRAALTAVDAAGNPDATGAGNRGATAAGDPGATAARDARPTAAVRHRLTLENVPLYGVVLLTT